MKNKYILSRSGNLTKCFFCERKTHGYMRYSNGEEIWCCLEHSIEKDRIKLFDDSRKNLKGKSYKKSIVRSGVKL